MQSTLKKWKFLTCFPDHSHEAHFQQLLRILKFKHYMHSARKEMGN